MRALLLALPSLGSLNEKIVYAHRAARDEPPRWFLPLRRISTLLRHPRDLVPDGLGMLLTFFPNVRVLLQSFTLLFQRPVLLIRQSLVIFGRIHVLRARSGRSAH